MKNLKPSGLHNKLLQLESSYTQIFLFKSHLKYCTTLPPRGKLPGNSIIISTLTWDEDEEKGILQSQDMKEKRTRFVLEVLKVEQIQSIRYTILGKMYNVCALYTVLSIRLDCLIKYKTRLADF